MKSIVFEEKHWLMNFASILLITVCFSLYFNGTYRIKEWWTGRRDWVCLGVCNILWKYLSCLLKKRLVFPVRARWNMNLVCRKELRDSSSLLQPCCRHSSPNIQFKILSLTLMPFWKLKSRLAACYNVVRCPCTKVFYTNLQHLEEE